MGLLTVMLGLLSGRGWGLLSESWLGTASGRGREVLSECDAVGLSE